MEITKDDIKFKIFKKKHIATVIGMHGSNSTLLIPRFVEYNQEQYKIVSIGYSYNPNSKIESIIFPEDSEVETFENGSFNFMKNLKKLQIPKSLKFIENDWINDCSNLIEIEVSSDNKLFSYIDNKILVGKSSEDIDEFDTLYFTKSDSIELVIPSYIKYVKKLSYFKAIIFQSDSKLKEICENAFNFLHLDRLVLPGRVEKIHHSNFQYFDIKQIEVIGENRNYTVIDNKFFVKKKAKTSEDFDELLYLLQKDCEEVTIPSQIEYVNKWSLYNNQNIKSIFFPSDSKLKIIEEDAIYTYNLTRLILPGCVENIGGLNFFSKCNKLIDLQINGECKYYYLIDNKILLNNDDVIYTLKDIETAAIPSNVKTISSYAFLNCKHLAKITFPSDSSLERICEGAFCKCSIDKIIFPESVKYVDSYAFSDDDNLSYIQFNSKIIDFSYACFKGCVNLEVISIPNATNINIYTQIALPDEAEIHVRRDVIISGDFSNYKEQIKYVFGPDECKKEEHKIEPLIPSKLPIKTEIPPKSNKAQNNEQQQKNQQENSKQLQMYLKHIRFLEQRLSKYERVIPFDPSTNHQKEESDYEADEKNEKKLDNFKFFMDDNDEEGHKIVYKIGEGNSSIAYKVIDQKKKRILCKKVLKEKEYGFFSTFKKKMKEMEVLQQDRHPSICEVIGVNIQSRQEAFNEEENSDNDDESKEKSKIEKEDDDDDDNDDDKNEKNKKEHKNVSFYFEYLPYNLSKCLSDNILNNTMKVKIAIEVAFGMSFIHSRKQIHRNLNINNIRLNNVYESKIINFSQTHDPSFGISNKSLTKSKGEIAYMSPEMACEEDYNEKTDVYSYGVTLHVLFSGKPPKQSINEKMSKKEPVIADPSKWISSKCIELIKKCILNEIQQRPSFDEIIDEIYSNEFELASEIDKESVLRRYLSLNRFRSQHQNKS